MRLSQFILANTEKILSDFEAFARTLSPDNTMDRAALRDHAQELITVIAHDLDTPQTKREELAKSKGHADSDDVSPDTAAQEHGAGRAISGFTAAQMVSEYRAMRASVIRLWLEVPGELDTSDVKDLVRFNEAIDQALAESTSRFMADLDQTRDTFVGVLGHDLRTPLSAITMTAKAMLESKELTPNSRILAARMQGSADRMADMVSDLLDFTRSRLGVSTPIVRESLDLEQVIKHSVEEIKAAQPDADVTFETSGNVTGEWDSTRLTKMVSNLISNAISHGSNGTPIAVSARGEPDHVVFSVHNQGPAIPREQFREIFNPLSRSTTASQDSTHMGLGLYIAEQVVTGHLGKIDVESTEEGGTTFTVRLPRAA